MAVSVGDEENVDVDYYASLTMSRAGDEDSYSDYTVYVQEDAGKTETEPVEEVPSLEELERELFGTPSTPEPKDIRKIDKFYE